MYKLPSRIEISWMILAACHSMFGGNRWHSSTSKTEDKLYCQFGISSCVSYDLCSKDWNYKLLVNLVCGYIESTQIMVFCILTPCSIINRRKCCKYFEQYTYGKGRGTCQWIISSLVHNQFQLNIVHTRCGYKITGCDFFPLPCKLGNGELCVVLACTLPSIHGYNFKVVRQIVWQQPLLEVDHVLVLRRNHVKR